MDADDDLLGEQVELGMELATHGSTDAYIARKGNSKRTRLVIAGAVMLMAVILVLKRCGDDARDDEAHARLSAATAPPTTPAPTTQPDTTLAPTTTTVQPSTTAPATTTAATTNAAAPETLAAFTAASDYHDQSLGQIAPDLEVAGLQVYCDEAAQIDAQFIQDLNTTTFGAAVQPQVNTLVAALTATQQIEANCAAAESSGAASTLWNAPSTMDALQAAIDAETAVRAALGLPPTAG